MLIIAPIIIVALSLEVILRMLPSEYRAKSNYLDKNSNKIETLILGNSHAFYGINPEYLSGYSFNAGHLSQPLKYDVEILKKYHNNWENLHTIVLNISYLAFYWDLLDSYQDYRIKDYVLYYKMPSHSLKYYSEVLSCSFEINLRRIASSIIKNKKLISNENGWGNDYHSSKAENLVFTGTSAAKRHTITDHKNLPSNIEYFKYIINFCNQRNIRLILFTAPGYESYYNNLDEKQLNSTYELVEKLTLDCNNCEYHNMLYHKDFVAEDYFDGDHLNEIGAKKFTLLMKEIIDRKL